MSLSAPDSPSSVTTTETQLENNDVLNTFLLLLPFTRS